MEQKIDIAQALAWSIDAGIDVTCGDSCCLKTAENINNSANIKQNILRPAVTSLSQAPTQACKNARDVCLKAENLAMLKSIVENFEGCGLKSTAKSTVFGAGNEKASIMLIGEAPGADEDRIGLPFVGKSGQLLDKMLFSVGIKREDVFITNVLPWRPPGNRPPTDAEIAVCLPFLKRQIELVNPDMILLLGGSAASTVLDTAEPISKLRGRWLEYNLSLNAKIPALATFHPAYLLRNCAQKAKSWSDFLRLLKKLKEN